MNPRYIELKSLIIRKGNKNNPFFIKAAIAKRVSDNKKGLLIQHSRKLHGKITKQAASFFVKQNDIHRFLKLTDQLLKDNIEYFDYGASILLKKHFQNSDVQSIIILYNELKEMEEKIKELSQVNGNQLDTINEKLEIKDEQIKKLTTDLAKARTQRLRIQYLELERRVPQFRQLVQNFKNLIENGKEISKERGIKQESLYQDFLVDNFWMFGIPYISVQSKPKSSKDNIPDILLQRSDGFNDVVELENPTDNIFIKKAKRFEQSKALKEALAQTMDYLDDYALGFKDAYYDEGIETFKPNGIIVIGRSSDKQLERRRRQLNSYLHGIEIWTYDDLVRNAEQVITLLERGPFKKLEQ